MELEQKNKKDVRVVYLVATVMFLALIGLFLFMVFSGVEEPAVNIADGTITIDVKYGVSFPVSEVAQVTLLPQSMDEIGVGERTNGYGGFDTTRLGHFHSDALGDYLLYAKIDASPTIWIDRAGSAEDVYLSFEDSAKTEAVFAELSAVVPQG
ncbi:MAG: hypothetical protein CVV04_07290 [Firmicutes bacterium HGW-Firmicutes-9]|jgi:hypothetical protein|nr:MAG: hypothetical protein CVV04_07290 [Firmicutes bacterium HGW-Firmicutes-9]